MDQRDIAERAEKLGLRIIKQDEHEPEEGIDLGPFILCDIPKRSEISERFPLPIEGIVDALDCYERELQLRSDGDADPARAWRHFGSGWRR